MITYLNDIQIALRGMNAEPLAELARQLQDLRIHSRTLFVCGNGGSHSVAEHWGVDLMKAGRLETHTLGTNLALLTALSNDLDYTVGLSTELSMRAQPNDMLVCLSCSGKSRNIASTLNEARKLRMHATLITGLKAPEYPEAKVIRVFSTDYGVLEDVFSMIGHWLTRELSS